MLQQRQSRIPSNTFLPSQSFNAIDFDIILAKCGDFGRYQLILLILYGVVNILVAMHYFAQTIIGWVPQHWCYHENFENKTFDQIEEIYKDFPKPSCTKLKFDGEGNAMESEELCTQWIYKYDFGFRSMNTELNWVCHEAYKSSVGQSFFFIGSLLGTLIYGYLSDKIGRLPALIISSLSGFIGDISTTFCYTMWSFSMCRFISGLASDTNSYLMYIIVLEYIRPTMRSVGLNLSIGIFYCIGLVGTPWLAILSAHWQNFLKCTSFPMLIVLTFYFIVQESAQWLVTRNRVEDAIRRLKNVATINGKQVDESEFDSFRANCEHERRKTIRDSNPTLIDMFRTPRMRNRTLILFFKSMVITLCFDAVSRNVENIGISPFIAFSVAALAVLPAGLVLIVSQNRIGRKGMAIGALLFGGIVTTITGIIIVYAKQDPILLLSLAIAARFGVAIAFESGSQYAVELIPTCVRGQGVAAVHVAGFAASFLVPYILYLGMFVRAAPSIILGILFFSGAFVCLLLPETLNKPLPRTLEEGEEFGKGESICSFYCCKI